MDGLAKSYSRQPIVFLEYDLNSVHAYERVNRFHAAWNVDHPTDPNPDTPMTMVDSGFRVQEGECNYRVDYGNMIDDALPRPPGLAIFAHKERPDTASVHVTAQIHNIGETTLKTDVNGAVVHIVLYEGHRSLHTGREIHGTDRRTFDEPFAPGDVRRVSFEFNRLRGVNASQLEAVVFVDYMPDPALGRWDMLQGAIADTAPLPALPTAIPTATATATPTEAPADTPVPPTVTPTQEPEPTDEVTEPIRIYVPNAVKP